MSSRGVRHTLLVIVVAVMVATAAPVSGSHQLVTVSVHTSTADFEAGTLTNMTASGGEVTLAPAKAEYTFDSQPADSGIPDGWSDNGGGGTVDAENVTTKRSLSGSQSWYFKTSAGVQRIPSDQPYASAVTGEIKFSVYPKSNGEYFRIFENGTRKAYVGIATDGDLTWFNNSGSHTITTQTDLNEWITVTVTDIDPTTDSATIEWSTSNGESGSEQVDLPLDSGYTAFDVRFYSGEGYLDDITVNGEYDPRDSGEYISPNHTAENTEQGWVNLTRNVNATVTVTWKGDGDGDGTFETTLNQTTGITSSGNLTFTWSVFSGENVRVNVTVENATGNGVPAFTMADEGVQFRAAAPSVDNGAADPQGGEKITSSSPDLCIPVNDSDFSTVQGDSLDVQFKLDGDPKTTKTITSNQTVCYSTSGLSGGNHTWSVTVEDSQGHQVTSNSFEFRVPSTLFIYNESNATQLVDNVTVTITAYFQNGTGEAFSIQRTTSDGTVNMTGFPAGMPFIVVAEGENYHDRRIFVLSLYDTQRIYLLPSSEPVADTIFAIEDYSGDFPPDDTVLLVQRSLNGTWKTVLGDYFGATGQFPAQLALNERHRLVLLNVETGERRPLGSYTPLTAQTQEVIVSPSGQVKVRTVGVTAGIQPQLGRLPALNGTTVAVRLENRTTTVQNWTVTAAVGNTTLWSQTYTSPQRVTHDLPLATYAGQNLTVTVTYVDSNGTTHLVDEKVFLIQQTLDHNGTLLQGVQDLADLSPPRHRGGFTTFLAVTITVIGMAGLATQFRVSGEVAGLTGVFLLTAFSVVGWVSYDLVFVAGVGVFTFAGLRRGL